MFDNHIHCHELPAEELEEYRREWTLVCVSDDLATSKKTLEMEGVVRCLGIHPWQVEKAEPGDLSTVLKLLERREVPCVGEVGLDKRFVPHSFDKQREYFRAFLRAARELDLVVNVHAPDAWADVVEELRRSDVDRALIHWYTGPLHLLDTIRDLGYYISINPAVTIQKKHQEVAAAADRRIVLVESDGPYEYRGLRLVPPLIEKTVEKMAELWSTTPEYVREIVEENAKRLWRRLW
ncbi:TatD family hydrolase [Pyrobaculum calidifontis]|uniref:TatD-related deoxyribonuclease n=1 Tax=Pyrobaculum calidifontis (strain DSM 21063 / JCM 11548 / VA1) TaxID=410359 RepID=A3MUY3_PYRCJ|nr:TatD family hydrolase [Pyrobaculum calidifontis]ABO08450.1 TatD-related deoxyribonuclease [Pyrobaculum calidifontis JCM 11548]